MINPPLPYIRVGNCFFKIVQIPLISGDFLDSIIKWNSEFIKQDEGRDALSRIEKYDGFCVVPDHINFQQKIGNFYNRYLPFAYKPKKGEWKLIEGFLKHIFQDQYELGLDYFKLLLEKPTQKLPVLCLVSVERNTGKTTFLLFLKAIFGGNMTINTNEDFKSVFNSDWIAKIIIGVDETLLDRREDAERLKNLSTARIYKSEAKGQDRIEVEFFGKFVMASNSEDGFLLIEPGEIRYWVIKVMPIEKEINNLIDKLKPEIRHFIDFLLNREYYTSNESRMWFNPKLIETKALHKVIRRSRNKIELEILNQMLVIIEEKELDELCFCISDIQDWLNKKGFKAIEFSLIKRILQNEWKLEPASNSYSYSRCKFFSDGGIAEEAAKGRYYKISKELIIKYNE
jgi:hypothetical protein